MALEMIVVLGLATATVSTTLGVSKVFKPLRRWVEGRWEWGGTLIGCPYCLGHWVAAALVVVSTGGHVTLTGGVVMWLAVTAISGVVSGLLMLLLSGGGSHEGE